MRNFIADLHIHTVLSPCADYRMVPALILERAVEAGLDLLAVTDHNSGENAAAMVRAAEDCGVAVLPGMEVESREGVHILTLFDSVDALGCWQEIVYASLPSRENDERVFGAQLVVDFDGELIGLNRRLLITAVDLSLEEVAGMSREIGALCVPAHVDRPAYGLLSVLGVLPVEWEAPALEISSRLTPAEAVARFPQLKGHTLLRSSDAHTLEDVGRATSCFTLERATVAELRMACRGEQGRGVVA